MRFGPKAALGVAALIGALALGTSANAAHLASLNFNKCTSAKVKQVGKTVAAYTGCNAKGASKNIPTDGLCLSKASGKHTAAFAKLDAKGGCLTTGDGASEDSTDLGYANSVDSAVGHGSGGDPSTNKCDAAKQKLVGKYVAAIAGCYAKSAGKAATAVDGLCLSKAEGKLSVGIGKAEAKPPCTNTNALQGAADTFINARACALDVGNSDPACGPVNPCGNGINDPGEKCDASAPSAGWAACGPDFTCTACNCACPTKVRFSGDATAPESVLDTGFTGISHRAPIISNGDVTVNLSCSASSRPCGVCNINGVTTNTGTNLLNNKRCDNDSSKTCNTNADCPGGTCAFYFGAPLPLAAGGVTTCVFNTFDAAQPVTGTANVETGDAKTSAHLLSKVYLGFTIDGPCARCVGDTTINDGVKGGTCDNGTKAGQACDANGFAPGRPDFGRTSLDCPIAGSGVATLPIDLSNSTGTVTKTLTAASPFCRATGYTGEHCLCDTCNNVAQGPCTTDADCPTSGGGAGICGGKRCLGGPSAGSPCLQCVGGSNHAGSCTGATDCPGGTCTTVCGTCVGGTSAGANCALNSQCPGKNCQGGANNGTLCTVNSQCPGGSCVSASCSGVCGQPGASTASNQCSDDTNTPSLDCTDGGDGEGVCDIGPLDNNCSAASGHPQRGCTSDADCDNIVGACQSINRNCFLTGGLTGEVGTSNLTAVGMSDTPMGDASNPTLGAVFCVAPTGASSINSVAGLPGPGRVTIKGNASGHP